MKICEKNQIAFVLTVLLMTVSAACAQNPREASKTATSPTASSTTSCAPLETRTANAPEQKPAFPGQTRGCAVRSDVAFEVTVLATGLDKPWAVEPLPNGDFLITEKT
ncbi:MAG TPA: hypothetical protein VK308_11995, partial [Pyrinomonadaceae bacterium]|nr:hypothetical protein [Pyrinomonadaceae bacterium]